MKQKSFEQGLNCWAILKVVMKDVVLDGLCFTLFGSTQAGYNFLQLDFVWFPSDGNCMIV